MKTLRSDNGGEYTFGAFTKYLSEKGIRHQRTAPYTPMQNGVAERMNWTIQDRVTVMLQYANLKKEFWAEALHTTVYVINLSPSTAIGQQVPQALWSGQTPRYDRLRIFGCKAYVFVQKGK